MIVIPPRAYLYSIKVKMTCFISSWYKKCMFNLLGTLCDLSGTLFDHLAMLFDLPGPLLDLDLPGTLYDHSGTLFQDVLISPTRQLWIWLNRNKLNIIQNLLRLQNETGEYGRPSNLFLNESICHWGVTCLVLLYLTLPLVFPPESGRPPESHCSPSKVQDSDCSPGGSWWDCFPTLVPFDSCGNPVGIPTLFRDHVLYFKSCDFKPVRLYADNLTLSCNIYRS